MGSSFPSHHFSPEPVAHDGGSTYLSPFTVQSAGPSSLLSNNKQLKRWEVQTVRTYLIRTAGKLLTGGKQLRLNVPDQHLHADPWEAWLKLSFI